MRIVSPLATTAATLCALIVGAWCCAIAAAADSTTLNEFKSGYRRAMTPPVENRALVDLGRDLFFDPVVSSTGATSCATCHRPQTGFTVNEPRSRTDSGQTTFRRTQTLLGIGHARPPFDWDGRAATLEAQAVSSIGIGSMSLFPSKTPVKVDEIMARLRVKDGYAAKFKAAFPDGAIKIDNVVVALAAFQRTIEPGEAPFDRFVEGDEQAISESAKRGFVLFNGTARCAQCHGGWRFTDDLFHDIGTSITDLGRGAELKRNEKMQYAFKTPTLRQIAQRAPYMHDGSIETLRDVLKHYVKGGIDRPSRSPQMVAISLSEAEQDDLIAFLETLTEDRPR
ncbi:MAG: cytochrome c peroxidase [Pseudorhodoplanes sp.]